ncbi:KAP family P-loop NTPase fold protein [Clostridium estertheticum]|uniref:KAP family P-loop NTPase fold protein n=1 Tax=Clostridium estertheticum TaxID=238834 RepID=UPI001C0B6AFC|nr:P-loop NTPase fold protein [Clostridium estertheticum]MBU3073857.1 KAP family NTPase [Clostridium estertheticum]MBU3163952.1 KAP family NTPase [Clostridium estertheticum]
MEKINHTISVTNFSLLFKSFLVGALLTEVLIIAKVVCKVFVGVSNSSQKEIWLWAIASFYCLIIGSYLFKKERLRRMWILLKSLRIDLLILIFSGASLVRVFGGVGVFFLKRWFESLSWLQLTVLILFPVMIYTSLILKKLQDIFFKSKYFKREDRDSLFMSDKEGENTSDDEFNFSDKAKRFAERVFNQRSQESLVFGIDAPWGTGKSTFLNLCKEYWNEKHKNEMIIYNFDPLRHENKEKLLEIFIDGLIKEIRNHAFAPEIESLVSKYAKLLKNSKPTFSFLGLRFDLPSGSESMDDVFNRLKSALINIDKKIIVIVDDLDRLNFSSIKEVLFVVKKAFTLPNISYVLCYDTENIMALEQRKIDTEKISEFLEKFINVKISLYLENKLLLEYFTQNKDKSLFKNPLVDPQLVSKAVEGLKDIFESKDFHHYLPFIGDARKLKRLINTILLLEVDKTDFENSDFDKQDLIHLLLIYINYPNIFRKIYNTETQGKKGFFSVVTRYEEGYPKTNNLSSNDEITYKNSEEYSKYINSLTNNQQFILNKVFDLNQKMVHPSTGLFNFSNLTEEMVASYACFNGSIYNSKGRNLESYLNLITNMSRPIEVKQHKFYMNLKSKILSSKTIEEIFQGKNFSFSESESTHKQLWRMLVNSSNNEFTPKKSKEVICYALNNFPKYSVLEINSIEVGFRNSIAYLIAKLLDKVGWLDKEGGYINNTDENVAEIAKWIFGEGGHEKEGILDILGGEERGVLGLYDLLSFRMYCCADRGGDISNLVRSLSKHGDAKAPTSGNNKVITIEEMREISQKVFRIFKSYIIDQKRNIFDEIDKLTMEDVCGGYSIFINSKVESGEIKDVEAEIFRLKSRLKAFIIFQLGCAMSDNCICCGYYDISENKDQNGISKAMNDYIFGTCFNPKINKNNFWHFIDFLLINLSNTSGHLSSSKYIPNINDFTKVLDKDQLITYWQKQSKNIKCKILKSENRTVYTSNYIASYAEDLEGIYKVLDEVIK